MGVNTSNWTYHDWQEQATAALRLARLVQHISEVRLAIVEFGATDGRTMRINANYLKSLEDQEKDLRAAVGMAASISRVSNIPTTVRPQF